MGATKLTKVFENFLGTVGPVAVINIVNIDIVSEDRVAHRILFLRVLIVRHAILSALNLLCTLMSRLPIGAAIGAAVFVMGAIIPLGI